MISFSTYQLLVQRTFSSKHFGSLLKDIVVWIGKNIVQLNIVKRSISILVKVYSYVRNLILKMLGLYHITLKIDNTFIYMLVKKHIEKIHITNQINLYIYNSSDKIVSSRRLEPNEYYIPYKKHLIIANIFHRCEDTMELDVYTRDKDLLDTFIGELTTEYNKTERDVIATYRYAENGRSEYKGIDKRNLKTVFNEHKQDMINDIEVFFDPNRVKWFKEIGRVNKMGYLLYGPPGTGKTSMIVSLASHFDKSIMRVTITERTELSVIEKMFEDAARKSDFVVFEDIDTLFCKESKFTFSDIINLLDGMSSVPNVILFFTTNHIDRLDPALIRPGRIDKKLLFDYASEETIRQLCELYSFKPLPAETVDGFISHLAANEIKLTPAHCIQLLVNLDAHIRSSKTPVDCLQILIDNIQTSGGQS